MLASGKTIFNNNFIIENKKGCTFKNFIKAVLYPVYSIIFNITILFRKKDKIEKKYYFSICSIFRDEAAYLKEWIEFHKIVGVEHFYLYNNFSKDNYKDILAKYVEEGLVTLIDWPFEQGQKTAYTDCYNRFSGETSWIAFIDLDEFIVPKYDTDIKEWIKSYEKYPSVAVYWKMFGTSGKISSDNNHLVTEQYTVSWDKLYNVPKCFFNTSFVPHDLKQIHFISGKTGSFVLPPINEHKRIVLWDIHRSKREHTIQINHYFSKAYGDYRDKKMPRGSAFQDYNQKNYNYFHVHELKNISADYTIFRFLIELKLQLGLK